MFRENTGLCCTLETLFFSNSLFEEVLEVLQWFRETVNKDTRETPEDFVMGVNVLDFNPSPSSPLTPRSGVMSKKLLSLPFPYHMAVCVVDSETMLCPRWAGEGHVWFVPEAGN